MAKRSIAITPIVTTGVRTSADLRGDASGFVVYEPLDTLAQDLEAAEVPRETPRNAGQFRPSLGAAKGGAGASAPSPERDRCRSERSPVPQRSRSLPPAKVGVFARLVADRREAPRYDSGTEDTPSFRFSAIEVVFTPKLHGLSAFLPMKIKPVRCHPRAFSRSRGEARPSATRRTVRASPRSDREPCPRQGIP